MNIVPLGPLGSGEAAREASLRHHEQAVGAVDGPAEGHDTSDRDADGRDPWILGEEKRKRAAAEEASEPTSPTDLAPPPDPTGQRGSHVDLSG